MAKNRFNLPLIETYYTHSNSLSQTLQAKRKKNSSKSNRMSRRRYLLLFQFHSCCFLFYTSKKLVLRKKKNETNQSFLIENKNQTYKLESAVNFDFSCTTFFLFDVLLSIFLQYHLTTCIKS